MHFLPNWRLVQLIERCLYEAKPHLYALLVWCMTHVLQISLLWNSSTFVVKQQQTIP